MRYIAMTVVALFATSLWATAPFNDTVGTTSVMLVAKKSAKGNATAWTQGVTYTQGAVVFNGGRYYLATNAGTAGATPPTHTTGEEPDGAVTWRLISANERGGVVVTVQTPADNGGAINLSLGPDAAVANKGLRLVGEGATIIFDNAEFQGAIHAISATGSNVVVGVQEF